MIVTLLTDLGTKDASVGAIKALLLQRVPGVTVIDLSHGVPRAGWQSAAYMLARAYSMFPPGTVHMAPVGIAAAKGNQRIIYTARDGFHFIAPDNGLLPAALSVDGDVAALSCKEYERAPSFHEWLEDAADVCGLLAAGKQPAYPSCLPVSYPDVYPPQATGIGIACKPLGSDRYENIVLNIRENKFRELVADRPFSIRTFRGGSITEVSMHYNDVERGKPLCRFNSSGYLEIAVNHGSALELFGIDPADASALAYHTVRISVQ